MTVQGSDQFADAPTIRYGSRSLPTPSAALTTEVGEAFPQGRTNLGRTAWWKFTAPATETVGVNLLQSVFEGDAFYADTWLAIWTGDTLDSLTLVAFADANPFWDEDGLLTGLSDLDFNATADTTYYVQAMSTDTAVDMEYVLEVGKLIEEYGDWVQPPTYERTGLGVANATLAVSEVRGGIATSGQVPNPSPDVVNSVAQAANAMDDSFGLGSINGAYIDITAISRDVVAGTIDYGADSRGEILTCRWTSLRFASQSPPQPAPAGTVDFEYEALFSKALTVALDYNSTSISRDVTGATQVTPDATATIRMAVSSTPADINDTSGWSLNMAAETAFEFGVEPVGTEHTGLSVAVAIPPDGDDVTIIKTVEFGTVTPNDPYFTGGGIGEGAHIIIGADLTWSFVFTLRPPRRRWLYRSVQFATRRAVIPPCHLYPRSAIENITVYPPVSSRQRSNRTNGPY